MRRIPQSQREEGAPVGLHTSVWIADSGPAGHTRIKIKGADLDSRRRFLYFVNGEINLLPLSPEAVSRSLFPRVACSSQQRTAARMWAPFLAGHSNSASPSIMKSGRHTMSRILLFLSLAFCFVLASNSGFAQGTYITAHFGYGFG